MLRISQSLGPGSEGCRLNPAVLEEAAGLVQGSLDAGADLLIVNKFGKHEASGRGFRQVIGSALSRGIPVLTGVNAINRSAFHAFAGEFAMALDPDLTSLINWVQRQVPDVA